MTTRFEILSKLQEIFDNLFVEQLQVTEKLSAVDVKGWGSLAQLSLMVAVEKAFGIRFSLGTVESTRNVGDLVALIEKCVQLKTKK